MHDLWAVTAYFNPMGYASRIANYRVFRERLEVPLLAVELGFGGRFELGPSDADVLIRKTGRDVLWHKEVLLNAAIRALPPSCTKVAWLDCDIVLPDPSWGERLAALLERHRLVQGFSHCYRLGRGEAIPTGPERPHAPWRSLVHLMDTEKVPEDHFRLPNTSRRYRYIPGIAWAARREGIQALGLYEGLILGSGDRGLHDAARGRQRDFAVKVGMNERQASHYLAWADRFHEWARGDLRSLEAEVFHLWHGEFEDRRYSDRYEDLRAHGFDPYLDVAKDPDGIWVWSSEKPEMHRFVERYFAGRREDGAVARAAAGSQHDSATLRSSFDVARPAASLPSGRTGTALSDLPDTTGS